MKCLRNPPELKHEDGVQHPYYVFHALRAQNPLCCANIPLTAAIRRHMTRLAQQYDNTRLRNPHDMTDTAVLSSVRPANLAEHAHWH
jgi:hypothetical protein